MATKDELIARALELRLLPNKTAGRSLSKGDLETMVADGAATQRAERTESLATGAVSQDEIKAVVGGEYKRISNADFYDHVEQVLSEQITRDSAFGYQPPMADPATVPPQRNRMAEAIERILRLPQRNRHERRRREALLRSARA